MIRKFAATALLVLAAACTDVSDLQEAPADLGQFRLGHNVVVASKMRQAALSRDATEEEWVAALQAAVEERFGRYEGERLYHLGISVEGFSIAPPGVPLVASPKSVLIIRATLWDDALGRKLNEEAKQFTVFETFSGSTIVGSGLTQTKEEQIQNLSRSAAKLVQNWMLQNPEWFPGIGAQPAAAASDETTDEIVEKNDNLATEG
ncbi:hypothetical protein KUW14_03935 [Pseudooceanicola nitratireducens]|uniref:hypothetical protein n=1 Tax=Pseudooceanicola nitratireducens TaxID=517719 RepID=UPI001C98E0D0|nr:hypothetical protein [Pseudooceanicola nitratireducens]MBY6164991.1 hypothetical protein [Pseudooceanicola nitratireducens]